MFDSPRIEPSSRSLAGGLPQYEIACRNSSSLSCCISAGSRSFAILTLGFRENGSVASPVKTSTRVTETAGDGGHRRG